MSISLPFAVCEYVFPVFAHVYVNSIVSVWSANVFFEWQVQYFRALSQQPVVSFLASQSCAVDSGLLSCTDTDGLTALYVAHRVGLGVL